MRKSLIGFCLILGFFFLFVQSQATCPEEPLDAGVCDTLHVEVYERDNDLSNQGLGPYLVRFPIYVTNDLESYADSISGFQIPLCYTLSNVTGTVEYCSLSTYWNTLTVNPADPAMARSIFRDLPDNDDPDIFNRMFSMARDFSGRDWDYKELNLDGNNHFWLAMTTTGWADQKWWEGSKVLLATMTFKTNLDPSTSSFDLCIDSCFWWPATSLAFANSQEFNSLYVPRHSLPVCKTIESCARPMPGVVCPGSQLCKKNDSYTTYVYGYTSECGAITDALCSFEGEGVENVRLINGFGLGMPFYDAEVAYDVVDHCGAGGTITFTVMDDVGQINECEFDIIMGNDPPQVNAPDDFNTAFDCNARGFLVSASDPNDDQIVSLTMDAFWCSTDSLRVPTVAANFDGTNPGEFWWNPGEGDQGSWIAYFVTEEECGLMNSKQVVVEVGSVCCGDANGDGYTNLSDAIKLLNFLFQGGDPPEPLCKGNVNCDLAVNLSDALYILNMLFKGGSDCCFDCCEGW
jgi:hypothetical protein